MKFKSTLALVAGCILGLSSTIAAQVDAPAVATDAQQESAIAEISSDSAGITLGDPIESQWEFETRISANQNTLGIRVSGPVLMDWPEQKVELILEQKSDNVGKLVFANNTDHAKQLSFKIKRMARGQQESVSVRYRVMKSMIIAPQDTTRFVLTKDIPRDLKTFLKHSPYIESNHKRIRKIAASLKDEDLSAWEQVETIFRWVRDNVEYKFDTKIHTCLDALDAKQGDCEELSSLFIAICRAQGIPARAVWIPDHTYPEFYLSDKDGNGHWFPCQAAGTYEFGSMTELKPILHKGDRFKIDGRRGQVRYLEPTLVASSGAAGLGWISRQIQTEDMAEGQK